MAMLLVFKLFFVFFISETHCSHFRGGILSWNPLDANPPAGVLPTVHFKWRVSFRRSYGSQHYCDQSLTSSQTLKEGEGTLTCDNGCSDLSTQLSYICTDFSDVEDWSTGIGQFDYLPTTATFDSLYASGDWITLANGGNGNWILRAKVNLTRRPDNGFINSSPTTSTLPIVRLQQNCPSRLVIPVRDPDGDFVKCRHADSQRDECRSICNGLDGTEILDEENCILEWTPRGSTGLYGYAIQVEDFLTSTDTNPLSSIPLQFLLYVIAGNDCQDVPEFVPPTPPVGSCIPISPDGTVREKIVVAVSDQSKSITSISTASPIGLYSTPLQLVQGSHLKYSIDVVWTPLTNISTQEILCYSAEDNLGLASQQECIFLVTASYPPHVLRVESFGHDVLKIVFDKPVKRPTTTANVTIIAQLRSQSVAFSENTLSSAFDFDDTKVVLLQLPTDTCQTGFSYSLSLGKGAVVTTSFCGIPNEPQDISFTVGGSDKLICPNDTVVNATNGEAYVTITWPSPVLPDGVTAKQVMGPSNSRGTYRIGTRKEIKYVFVTPNTTTYVCNFWVIVGPDPHPCPTDIEVDVLTGSSGGVAYWVEPASRDKVLSNPPLPGSFFEIGIHPICYHFTTVTNDTDSCIFNVIVEGETPCNDSICGEHGTCVPISLSDFTCICDDCYQGDACETDFNVCSQNKCLNGGACHPFDGSCEQFYCDCPPCFYGEYCQLTIDACTNNECQNGALCVPNGDSCDEYTCQCSNCTYGTFCENEYLDPCSLHPCGLGKSCAKLPNTCLSYTCVAAVDTHEGNCPDRDGNVVENSCNSFPCKFGGSCIVDGSGYICLCRQGFGGRNCRNSQGQFVDICRTKPCENGGQCLNSFTSNSSMSLDDQFTCKCLFGFGGANCSYPTGTLSVADMCNGNGFNVCANNGVCSNTYTSTGSSNFVCNCAVGFIGQKCDLETVDPCSSNPCKNGATCISYNTYFICNCPKGLNGTTCERLTGNSTAPSILNCPGPIIVNSTVPTVVPWQWPTVTDITGYPVSLVEANSAPEAVHEPESSLTVKLVYESLAGIRAVCSFVIVVSGDGQ